MPGADSTHRHVVARPVVARRVVAAAAAIDAASFPPGALVMRWAPDDVFVVGDGHIAVDDPHAIVEEEHGYSMIGVTVEQFEHHVRPHIEWPLPSGRPTLAQGYVANVPAKLWLGDAQVLVVVATAYVDELVERLG